ncbi:hypothetical protein DSM104299_00087 [Baekduia alba]|uniref:LytR C-terminal domain-containing protein n=1 Tax=Baekduia alba TaxID=2997333 RepID=UPI002340CFA1|nr:LytR C-terminal domain-containing protein [Baekduia alba]WCB91416.1 hypothetical protein DSM104299_00087 [Baekduia alba]
MSSILALSVSDKIEQYGAYAGFASVLGLAILSLLYFAQAREVKRLREWAGRAPERAQDVQERAVAVAQQRVIAQPQRPAQPAQPQQPGAPRPAAATPAGQAGAVPAPTVAAAATAAGAATATPPSAAPKPPVPAPAAPGGQPTTVQPAANGAAATAPPARPGEPLRVPAAAATPPPGSTRTNYGPDDGDDDHRSRLPMFGAIAAIAVVVVVLVVLLTGVLGGSDGGTQKANTIGTPGGAATTPKGGNAASTTKAKAPAAAPKPGTYTVAVLNGTTVPGLARGVSNRLTNAKYKIGNVTNAATQDRSATLVEFAPGHRAEADSVAKAIDVQSDSIQQLSPGSKTIAGNEATVVVTVGADQNTSPQSSSTTP